MSFNAREVSSMSEEEVDLWRFLEKCTPEAKWFLKVLQHFSSKLEDRAEIRINKYDSGITVSTYKSTLYLTIEKGSLFFSFKRTGLADVIGRWYLFINDEKGKEIISEFLAAIESIPLDLGDILRTAKRIDDIIREEKKLLRRREIENEEESD
jgi:hypothetical protein